LAFENLEKIQPSVALTLNKNLSSGLLPRSILFSGPRGTGRLTGALDLAFHLTGERRDVLRTQNIIYFPHREMLPRVKAAVAIYKEQRTRKARLFLIETLREVNMQYNDALVSGLSQASLKMFETAQNVDLFLSDIEDRDEVTDRDVKALDSLTKSIFSEKYLYCGKSSPTCVSIELLRSVKEWMTSSYSEKVVIIEDLESATEGAKNSILKMLEEPDEHFTIILVSSQSQRIMETILSRVRKFTFPSLTGERISSLIKERFNVWENYSSFDSFYFREGNDEESVGKCEEEVSSFVTMLSTGGEFALEKEEELNTLLSRLSAYGYFRERVIEETEERMRKGSITPLRARRLLDIISRWSESVEIYNMNDRSGLDYMIREASSV
jgi:DNA polymerase III delta prime subunit